MKKTISFLVAIILSIGIIGYLTYSRFSTKKPALRPIRISLNVWPGYAHAFIAQEKGLFKKK